ncbi:hypothetical protein ASPFODRAFT_52299 [Aspergillus luchuensis CBS 106.47]|uniref:Uncharacterized protein n=1 Tax=Aspergillus luchuensis (strain CBS 106.47) TaxID=1137211 RepID=A0A1M3T3D7_ASPLC|nr:hypothetical protein ASPFODRAFT_52299 [Aspergillus luchuensis CBS 106.47]
MGWAVLTAHVRESVIPTVCCHSRKLSTLVLDLPLRSSSMMHLILGLFFWLLLDYFPHGRDFTVFSLASVSSLHSPPPSTAGLLEMGCVQLPVTSPGSPRSGV